MIYEEFKPFLLAACFPCDQHHNISLAFLLKQKTVIVICTVGCKLFCITDHREIKDTPSYSRLGRKSEDSISRSPE